MDADMNIIDSDRTAFNPPVDTPAKEQRWIPARLLRVDPNYQRPLDNTRANKIAKEFDPDALGTIEVSRRADGGLFILDGQHRVNALFLIGWSDQKIPCLVHFGLSVEDEARVFRMRNSGVRPNSLALFRAEIAEGGAEATDIDRIVRQLGLKIAAGGNTGTIQAASALRRAYKHAGGLILTRTLRIILDSWGQTSSNFQADIIVALALVQKRYGDRVDRVRLAKQLQTVTPTHLMATARSTKLTGSGSLWAGALPELMVGVYNKGLRSDTGKKLPAWDRRTNVREVWT